MNDSAREALKGSIAKWEAIVAGTGIDEGPRNCPLCLLFRPCGPSDCSGCPVKVRTGRSGCADSPYEDWELWCENNDYDETPINAMSKCDREEASELAKAELEFLKSLRDEQPAKSELEQMSLSAD